MTCEACQHAETHPRTGMYQANCLECKARALANSPLFFDSQKAGTLTAGYRKAMEAAFGHDWKDAHAKVKAWAKRLKEGTT